MANKIKDMGTVKLCLCILGILPLAVVKGCLYLVGIFLFASIAFPGIACAACIAAGVGLWLGIRYSWRCLVAEKPGSGMVKRGMSMAPIGRKVLAGVPCAVLSLILLCTFVSWIGASVGNNTALNSSGDQPVDNVDTVQSDDKAENSAVKTAEPPKATIPFDYSVVPSYNGNASVQVNGNVPYFTDDEIQYAKSNPGFEIYGDQDCLGRCTTAWASVGIETMPADGEERGEIGQINPTGWQTVEYDSVPGKYLYNRCHLLGWQLTNENSNAKNLITGTYAMSVDGMLKYEDDVASYVKSTGNHVLYRATPLFVGDELLARGVLIEARSLEDDGAGLQFCVWVYNAQAGITIDYADGSSSETPLLSAAEESTAVAETESAEEATANTATEEQTHTYILNTNTGKFHVMGCSQVKRMKDANKSEVESTRADMIARGYSPCQKCNP